jgi:hypothetical protein
MKPSRRCYDVEATHHRGFFTVHVQVRTHDTLADALQTLLAWQQEGWDRVALMPVGGGVTSTDPECEHPV